MPSGGARPGSGRKLAVEKAIQRLDTIKTEMQQGFYTSSWNLAKAMPELTREAIEYARNGDKNMLRFLIDLFFKLVSAIPTDDTSVHKVVRERILKIVETYASASDRPEVVDSSSRSDNEGTEGESNGGYVDAVFRPLPHQISDGGREERQVIPRSTPISLPPPAG